MSDSSIIRLRTALPGPESIRWMARRNESIPRGPAHAAPVFIASGDGMTVTDVDGNRLLDCAGRLGCLNVGHTAPTPTRLSISHEKHTVSSPH